MAITTTEKSALLDSHDSRKALLLEVSISKFLKSGKELIRSLGFSYIFAYVVGILFGSGVFISPGLVAQQSNNMGTALVIWTISGTICIFGALCFCELASALKKAGGEYIFIKEAFGDLAAFSTIWAQTVVIIPTAAAVLAVTIGEYLVAPFSDITTDVGIWLVKGVAVLFVILAVIINSVSTSFVGKTQVLFTTIQTISVIFFVALGIWKVSTGATANYRVMFRDAAKLDIGSFSLALYNGLWAYDGWGLICTITEELTNPERDLRLAIITGVPFVIVCYVLINLAFMSVLTHSEIASSSTVATTFVQKTLGKKVALLVPVAAALSCFSCLNATMLICSRAVLSGSREGHLPLPFSYIHAERRTPVPAILLLSSLTTLWILSLGSGVQMLVLYFSFAVWLTYGLAIFGVIILRIKQPKLPRPFKVWIINPILMTLVSLFLVVAPFIKKPLESAFCLASLLTAIPIYCVFVWKSDWMPAVVQNCKKKFYRFILLRCNLVPCVNNNIWKEPDVSFTAKENTMTI